MSDAKTDLNQDSVQKFVTWTRTVGVLYVILGGISCIGIITAAVGIPEIFAGIRMQKAGEALKNRQSGNDSAILAAIVDHTGQFAKIMGIGLFVGIALAVVALVVYPTFLVPRILHRLGR
jgi:hypothetical protein